MCFVSRRCDVAFGNITIPISFENTSEQPKFRSLSREGGMERGPSRRNANRRVVKCGFNVHYHYGVKTLSVEMSWY